jgi:glycolate oxidase iron-sulfur subunit
VTARQLDISRPSSNPLATSQLQTTLAREEEKLLACIHCGLCLEACPTYVITGDENDGPRGRLYLMRAVAEGRLENTSPTFDTHINRCLGCRACEQVCPAGVEYGQLLEASREELVKAQPKHGPVDKLLRFTLQNIWQYPNRLKLFFSASRWFRTLGLAKLALRLRLPRLISPRAEFAVALLESSRPIFSSKRRGKVRYQQGQTESPVESVLLFRGCVGEGLFARINDATERVLEVNNVRVTTPEAQVCCGALHAHAGDLEGARVLARKNLEAFDSEKPIITNAGGCGAMLVSYGHLFAHDEDVAGVARRFSARVKDVSQQLATMTIRPGRVEQHKVTYDTSCHLLYGQKAGDTSKAIARQATGNCYVELDGTERCCGAAGIYNLLQPELSQQVLNEKLTHVRETNADILATGNPGCQMHIGAGARLAGMSVKVCHPIELLDEAYWQTGVYAESEETH